MKNTGSNHSKHFVAFFLTLLSILSLLPAMAWAQTTVAGTTPGQFAVSPSGAATYHIPIQVPPGVAGMEPKLALLYNSQSGNGMLGMGWGLSGLSAITRCPQTKVQDGVRRGVNYDANDRYCLDGQRLIATSGSYGANGTEYHTEHESFSKVTSLGSAGNGPAYFVVKNKAGLTIEYGNTENSRIEAQGKTSVKFWSINKITDTKGNYLTVSYAEDSVNGEYYPSRIDYAGNTAAGLAPNNSIQFQYESRPDIVAQYFQGSLTKSTQRLKTIQTWVGGIEVREYRLTYAVGNTNRSRVASLNECAMPENICMSPTSFTWSDVENSFGAGNRKLNSDFHLYDTAFLIDAKGNGRAGVLSRVTYEESLVEFLNNDGLLNTNERQQANGFSFGTGYGNASTNPYFPSDVNTDGKVDIVGFANDGVYVAISNGNSFGVPSKWSSKFGVNDGWANMEIYPRTLVDVNGDGLPDIVGFKNDGVYVALNTGNSFDVQTKWTSEFGTASSIPYANSSVNPRLIQDMNGDGLPDIVGFANSGVFVSLNTGSGFAPPVAWTSDFSVNAGYTTQDTYPRVLADVNGDGLPDVVGFKSDGVYVAINTGVGFLPTSKWLADFGTATSTAYPSQEKSPRYVIDMNGDGKADVVGFAAAGIQVALSTGAGFSAATQWVSGFGINDGYGTRYTNMSVSYPNSFRLLGDLDGDGFPDVVGLMVGICDPYTCYNPGIDAALSARVTPPDLILSFMDGFRASTTVTYQPLTNDKVYDRGAGAIFPVMDVQAPMYVVASVKLPNALNGGFITTNYHYESLKSDVSGRGLMGFGSVQTSQAESGLTTRTDYLQGWPYTGVSKSVSVFTNSNILRQTSDSYSCLDPQTGAICTVGAGSRYFVYRAQSIEESWDLQGTPYPSITNIYTYGQSPQYGDPTQISISTNGNIKTILNEYGPADTNNWILGRLKRATVTSVGPDVAPAGSSSSGSAPLTLSAISPNEGPSSGGTVFYLMGTGFGQGATVRIGDVAATGCMISSSTTIRCTSPASSAGTKDVIVTAGGTSATLRGAFTVVYQMAVTIATNTNNFNLRASAIAAGWDQASILKATITVNSGVVVGSSSTSAYAFETGTGFPSGSTLKLINNGFIVGMGGAGAYDTSEGNQGTGAILLALPGGPALHATASLLIANNGTIGGGGGGGGVGGYDDDGGGPGDDSPGGGGGGGQGSVKSPGGNSLLIRFLVMKYPSYYGSNPNLLPYNPLNDGTYSAPGIGANGYPSGRSCGGLGGDGGTLGMPGKWGQTSGGCGGPVGEGTPGAAGGPAVVGNANITWLATGTRLGALDPGAPIAQNPDPTNFVFNPLINISVSNYNLRAAAVAAGWNQVMPLKATVTINTEGLVSASSVGSYAFDTGVGFPAGSTLVLINAGSIVGMGGAGGDGGYGANGAGSPGQVGGPALRVQFPMTVTNSGTIGGGGNGGAGGNGSTSGGSNVQIDRSGGGGGGGRTGATNSAGGSPNGKPGTAVVGGAGGIPFGGNTGKPGGDYGGGPAVVGNANITWLATGTRLGALN